MRKIKPMPPNNSLVSPSIGIDPLCLPTEKTRRRILHKTIATATAHSRIALLSVCISISCAATKAEDAIGDLITASSVNGASSDAQETGIDTSLSADEIQQKIVALEAKGLDALSDAEFDLLFAYQDQLLVLENQTQVENEATINEIDTKTLEGIQEIKNAIEG